MTIFCYCCVCKKHKPYDDVVSVRASARLTGDICLDCLSKKTYNYIGRNVVSAHQYQAIVYKNKKALSQDGRGSKDAELRQAPATEVANAK